MFNQEKYDQLTNLVRDLFQDDLEMMNKGHDTVDTVFDCNAGLRVIMRLLGETDEDYPIEDCLEMLDTVMNLMDIDKSQTYTLTELKEKLTEIKTDAIHELESFCEFNGYLEEKVA